MSHQVTEHCFQNTPAPQFHQAKSWIQDGADVRSRKEIPAYRTTTGTWPAGSMWTRNPIPAWRCMSGGLEGHAFDGVTPQPHKDCNHLNFEPPIHDKKYVGYGGHRDPNKHLESLFGFHVIDQLVVPTTIPPGDYVLSWRWDCEQTKQVWSQCSNIKIVDQYTVNRPYRLYQNGTLGSERRGEELGRSVAGRNA